MFVLLTLRQITGKTDVVTLYHGTTLAVSQRIETEGLTTVRSMAGNYATTDLAEADRYAIQIADARGDMPVIVEFEITDDEFDENWSVGSVMST